MTPVTLLARAAVRRHKPATAVLAVLVTLTAVLVNLGLAVVTDFAHAFDDLFERTHTAHLAVVEGADLYSPAHADALAAMEGVAEVETEPAVTFRVTLPFNGDDNVVQLTVSDVTAARTMGAPGLVKGEDLADDTIWLPYILATSGGYSLGDRLDLGLGAATLTYTVAGFTDEALFGNLNNSWYRVYVTPAVFADLAAAAPAATGTLISARFSDPDPAVVDRVALDYTLAYHLADPAFGAGGLAPYSYAEARAARTFFPGIMSAILLAFAGLIAVVCLVAVRFRVRTSIEASMADIGVEKAVGYTSGQIAGALLLQFAGVTLAAAAAGVGLSYAVLPAVAGVLETQSALAWSPAFLPLPALVTLGSLVATVTLVTGLAAGRIRRLAPLTALRSGLATHSFRHNRFPLATTRGPLGGLLAAKQAVQGRGQLAMIGLIGALGAFAATVMLSTYASLAVNPGRLSEALMGELPDAFIGTVADDGAVAADLAGRDGVTSVFTFDDVQLLVDGAITVGRIVDDPAHLRGTLLTAGRYPSHANELVLGGARAKAWDKHAGDSVTVSVGGRTADYLVTGEMQNLTGFSYAVLLTEAGLHRVMPDFRPDSYYVYLDDPAGSDAFVAEVAQDPRVSLAVDNRALVISQQSVYLGAMLYAAVVVVAVTIALVGLVLYLVLTTAIRRRRQAYGVQKSVGFTTGQLMRQIAATYVPAAVVGVLVGAAVGLVATRPLFSLMFHSFGLDTVRIDPYLPFTLALVTFLAAFAYATSQAVSARLRHVSAYALVTE